MRGVPSSLAEALPADKAAPGMQERHALLENHLHFLGQYRGSLSRSDAGITVHGLTLLDETCFIPASEACTIPAGVAAVRLAPWSGCGWGYRLQRMGFSLAYTIDYMELAEPAVPITSSALNVRPAETEADVRACTAIDAVATATADGDADACWNAAALQRALQHMAAPDQRHYLAWSGGMPVATGFTLRRGCAVGVYALATLPQHRRQGFAAAILEQARRDALAAGCQRLILQALSDSYAEGYYFTRGFRPRFLSQVWRMRSASLAS